MCGDVRWYVYCKYIIQKEAPTDVDLNKQINTIHGKIDNDQYWDLALNLIDCFFIHRDIPIYDE